MLLTQLTSVSAQFMLLNLFTFLAGQTTYFCDFMGFRKRVNDSLLSSLFSSIDSQSFREQGKALFFNINAEFLSLQWETKVQG